MLDIQNVTQVDVLEEYQLLLVLSSRSLYSYSLSALDPNEPALAKRPKKIQSHCNFFKTGICRGRHLVCCIKSSALSTTVKVYEPNDAMSKGKKQKGFGKMFNAGQDELKPFKEFYIPTESSSVHFLKSSLCVACARGFEVVSLETLETQSLLDQADTSLDFVARKEGVKPIHIERLNGEFLLNYSDSPSSSIGTAGGRARSGASTGRARRRPLPSPTPGSLPSSPTSSSCATSSPVLCTSCRTRISACCTAVRTR